MIDVAIIDYGSGNLLSVKRAIDYVGYSSIITNNVDEIRRANKVILPGVGAYGSAMKSLKNFGLIKSINEIAADNIPILGICLGMQLLFESSDEFGMHQGLGLLSGNVRSIRDFFCDQCHAIKIPAVGWFELVRPNLEPTQNQSIDLYETIQDRTAMYFVHSFAVNVDDEAIVTAYYKYGTAMIPASVRYKNIFGVQFHPEKSGTYGLSVLRNFCAL